MPANFDVYRTFLDVLQVPAFLVSHERKDVFRLIKINETYEATVGIRNEDVSGKRFSDFLPENVAANLTQNYRTCVEREAGYSYEELLTIGDKERRWSTVLSPIFEAGHVVGVIGVAQDVTAAKTVERQLAQSLQAVSSINADLQALTSTTAHDLRGPMRQAKLIMDMIADNLTDAPEDICTLIDSGKAVVAQALALIDERVDNVQARIEVGIVATTTDVGRWCSEIVAILDPLGRLKFDYPVCDVECESFILDIGLRNLIDNAVNHAKSRVAVEVREAGENLRFSISDDGPGFPTGFELPAVSAWGDGTSAGIGLATTRRLIESRFGEMSIDDCPQSECGGQISFAVPGRIKKTTRPLVPATARSH
ncbi:MAG: PAS domain-containing sensor histidine kinase [Pseudomonadota bacterium]